MLERHAPRRPSFVFLSARHSTDAGAAFLHAGVPAVVCLRGYLSEDAIGDFVHEFYRHLLMAPMLGAGSSGSALLGATRGQGC